MNTRSNKPYLVHAIYNWCIDNHFTPFISVRPYSKLGMSMEYIKNDEVIFNISVRAVQDLIISNDAICFMARFNGISRKLEISMSAVTGIFAREVNQGIEFSSDKEDENKRTVSDEQSNKASNSLTYQHKNANKPNFRIVK